MGIVQEKIGNVAKLIFNNPVNTVLFLIVIIVSLVVTKFIKNMDFISAKNIVSSLKILFLICFFAVVYKLSTNVWNISSKTIMFIVFILVLNIILFEGLFKSKPSDSLHFFIMNIFRFLAIGYILLIIIFPNYKELGIFLTQNMSVVYIILNIVATLIFYKIFSISDQYKKIFLPIQIVSFLILFFMSLKNSTNTDFSLKYERLKFIFTFMTFISTFAILYSIYVGNQKVKSETYNNMALFLFLIMAGAFIYLLLFLDLYTDITSKAFNDVSFFDKCSSAVKHLILHDSKFYTTIFIGSMFLVLLFCMSVGVNIYPDGFLNNSEMAPFILFMMLIIFIMWILFFTIIAFPKMLTHDKPPVADISNISFARRGLVGSIGFIIIIIFVSWSLHYIHNLSGKSTFISAILNISIVILIISLLFKFFNVAIPVPVVKTQRGSIYDYLVKLKDNIQRLVYGVKPFVLKNPPLSVLVIFTVIAVGILLFNVLYAINNSKSKKLLSTPTTTDSVTLLATYDTLNNTSSSGVNTSSSVNFNYNYGISFWFYINALAPNTKASYSKFSSLLSYGDKPNILYNTKKNTLIVTIQQSQDSKNTNLNNVLSYDDAGNLIVYTNTELLLQKWNNIVINYTYGTLDIFLNGVLVKSVYVNIPYMTLDNLVIGEQDGINVKINNVEYFNEALTTSDIVKVSNDTSNLY